MAPMKDFAIDALKHNHPDCLTNISTAPVAQPEQSPSTSAELPTATVTSLSPSSSTAAAVLGATPVAPSSPSAALITPVTLAPIYPSTQVTPDELIDPILFNLGGATQGPLIDVRTMMFGGGPTPDLTDAASITDSSIGNKHKADASLENENVSPNNRATTRKRVKSKSGKQKQANSEFDSSTRPSRANAGNKYKEVRDQVKIGSKTKAKGRKGVVQC